MKGSFQSIASSSVIISASRFILKALGAVAVFLTLRELTMAQYGTVSLALSVSGPVLALSGLGLDDLIMTAGARARGDGTFKKYLPLYAGFSYVKIFSTALLIILSFWLKQFFTPQQQDLMNQFFVPLAFWIGIVSVRGLLDGTLQMLERFKLFAQAGIIEQSIRLCIIIAMFFMHTISVPNVIWSYVIAKIISTILFLPIFKHVATEASLAQSLREYFGFMRTKGFWETGRSLFGNIFSGINQWMVGGLMGLEAVGVLSFATTLNSLLVQALPFRQILTPFMARLSHDKMASSSIARRMSKYSIWAYVIIIAGSSVVFWFLLPVLLPAYVPALPLFYFFVFDQFISSATASHGSLLYAFQEQKFLFGLSTFNTILSFTLLPACILLFGVYGAVLESHIAGVVMGYIREQRLRKRHHITTFAFGDLFVFDDFDRTTLARFFDYLRTLVLKKLRFI